MTTVKMPNGKELEVRDGRVEGEVTMELSEIVEMNLEGMLDVLSTRLTGSDLLMDAGYEPVRIEEGRIVLKVEGDVSMILQAEGDEDDDTPSPRR